MSTFALPINELKTALTGLGKVISKRSTLPVLNTIKIERTSEGWITLTGTNLDAFATLRLEQPGSGDPEAILVPFDELQKTVKACGKGDVILLESLEENKALLRYPIGNQWADRKVESLPVLEFPEIPRVKSESIAVPDKLRSSLLEALACASTDETRYVLNGAYLDVSQKDCHHIVGTNGRCLYSSNSFALPLKDSLIIPSSKFIAWKEFHNDGQWELRTQTGDNAKVQINSRRWSFTTRLIEGQFPNWRQVVPNDKSSLTQVTFDPEEVASVLATIDALPCHDATNLTIGLEVIGNSLSLRGANSIEEGWTEVPVPSAKVTGKPLRIYLNRSFLVNALRFGLLKVDLIDAQSPLRFHHEGRQLVVMPVRVEPIVPSATPPKQETSVPEASQNPVPIIGTPTTERKTTMVTDHNPTDADPSAPNIDKIEESLELIETFKINIQDTLTGLKDLSNKLKQVQKDRKTSEREMIGIRNSIRSLQTIRV